MNAQKTQRTRKKLLTAGEVAAMVGISDALFGYRVRMGYYPRPTARISEQCKRGYYTVAEACEIASGQ